MSNPSGTVWEPESTSDEGSPYAPYGVPGASPIAPDPSSYPTPTYPPVPGYSAPYPSAYPTASYPAGPGYSAPYPTAPGYSPMSYRMQPAGPMPPNHLVLAIVALLFVTVCGIVAVIYSTQVESRWRTGDTAGAYEASEKARKWGWASIIISVGLLVLYLLFVMAAVVSSR